MTAFRHLLAPLFASAALLAGGCISTGSSATNRNPSAWRPPAPADVIASSGSVGSRPLRPDDTVEIALHIPAGKGPGSVSDVVDQFGVITLPLVGDIKVGSLTTSEAEKAIASAYVDGGYYQKVDVTVVCKSMMKEQLYYVEGSVRKNGSFTWTDNLTLRRALINAGGVNDFANRTIELTRGGVTTKYSLDRIERGSVEDPRILPGDVIKAQERWL
jgi:polysaccharide export outer membrane protein